jgi:hypothetical protein
VKAFYRLFFLVPLFAFANISSSRPFNPNASEQRFLLTFPKSGTNIISGYIQAIIKNPIQFIDSSNNQAVACNRMFLTLDFSKPVIYRTHHVHQLAGLNINGNKLLMILRNYKECIHRHAKEYKTVDEFKNLFIYYAPIVQRYFNTLSFFDSWDPNNRLLIYYEDLIANPLPEIVKVLTFFGESIPADLTEDFLRQARDKILDSYHQNHINSGGSHSKGADPRYHSKQIPLDFLLEIDRAVITQYPFLFQKYLLKYLDL